MEKLKEECDKIVDIIKKDERAIVDGVINVEEYKKASLRILWVLKEPNSSHLGWSYQAYFSEKEIERKINTKDDLYKYKTIARILYTSYGLLNKFIKYNEIQNKNISKIGEQIAYINIKKVGGGSSVSPDIIEKSYNENKELLLKQISVFNPNAIIFGNTLNFFREDLKKIGWSLEGIKDETVNESNRNTVYYNISKEKLCIHAYHPAYWRIGNETYCNEIIQAVEKWYNS